MPVKKWIFIIPLLAIVTALSFCESREEKPVRTAFVNSPWKNHHDTVEYVGMETCRSCHPAIYESYMHTGMGLSFDHATREKSAAEFGDHALVYDSISNFYYKPFWRNDSLFVKEFRVSDEDTIHSRVEFIAYVIGSGHHTNSHMIDINGYVFQAPITFYTQRGEWDMAPGFEGGFNSRFGRVIQMECMTCHNNLPEHEPGSENKYGMVPTGISCERCHGPGELHVKEKLAGIRIDTSNEIDYSIVNPAHLSVDLQMSLCQRCHLQGVALLNEGKSFADFKPGMHLDEVMNVFLPKFREGKDRFIMASHAERLRESACFIYAEMSCITCHNPHVNVTTEPVGRFNNKCMSCHGDQHTEDCSLPLSERIKINENNCQSCHMPKSESIDIPHVSITDHYIHVPGKEEVSPAREVSWDQMDVADFSGLKLMTSKNRDPLLLAKGFIRFFEGFSSKQLFLDSAAYYLRLSDASENEKFKTRVHLYYLQNNFATIAEIAAEKSLENFNDPYIVYRIGHAFMEEKEYRRAQEFLLKAHELMPLNPEFANRLGSFYVLTGKLNEAESVFGKVLHENPKYVPALSNMGIVLINLGKTNRGIKMLKNAIALNPDYELAYYNLADFHSKRFQTEEARRVIRQLLRHQPDNERAQQILEQLKGMR